MLTDKRIKTRATRRRLRVKKKVKGTPTRPRLVVYRSNQHVYAQLVNDQSGVVLSGASSLSPEVKVQISNGMKKVDISKLVGLALAKKAVEKGITQAVFDRSFYLYHGRVKALAEGAREGGLKF